MAEDKEIENFGDKTDLSFDDEHLYLGDRQLDSDEYEVLYHYCSAETLIAILVNQTLRFSDLTLLNDAEERIWGYERVFKSVLHCLRTGRGVPEDFPDFYDDFLDDIDQAWNFISESDQPFVCCLSTDGDSLSQWRAYAQDGTGFALGFSPKSMAALPASPVKVCYDFELQKKEMFSALASILNYIGDGPINLDDDYQLQAMAVICRRSIAFKNPAFRDEKEVRLTHLVWVENENGKQRLETLGGFVNNESVDTPKIQFQARNGTVVPFFDLPLTQNGLTMKLTHLSIGPKSRTSVADAERMLNTLGLQDVKVSSAGSLYR